MSKWDWGFAREVAMNVAEVLVENVHEGRVLEGFRCAPCGRCFWSGAGCLSVSGCFVCEGRKLPAWELYNHTKVLGQTVSLGDFVLYKYFL